ncbi:MAG: thiamine biosynthesis protein ThiS [Armatimonadetes bacterium CG2_30_59_28]|nr:sulfur carrier protein ThiS [Armatimonadota bacterium]OIO93721.1 MAG: thiamine biosynthesis protein ThiS [Armatimonadetes bacterium CG2_30_59_28]PIU60801.1 MAG: thiamine biosynthesis protein ThiS [Armatimonadetes bacterium CG07_land_8_20_14_0_80_59_28]PIX44596.1 MAG: thiamine biosynthesis protein ThiS [Armatimonadetes bacterium CG_4_8_14_3_um_filter_58_9]PIY44250.1 MAG: thiamine biosynthesis protein ThiS [Armatimonadetes bacterium CG_4_10_14_3_um_filter_59_10]PJB68721.1 MAG: thiamine biosyn
MRIKLNGEHRDIDDNLTIADLVDRLGLNRDGIAIAINRAVVPRPEHATTEIRDGDVVEVIHAAGGG